MREYILSLPAGGYLYPAAVGAHVVLLLGDLGRTALEEIAPHIAAIDIDRVSVTVEFPHAGHGNGTPPLVIVVGTVVVLRTVPGILHPVELPQSVKRDCREILDIESGMHRSTVHLIDPGIAPG